jgi:hypothetical protein
LPNWFKIIWWSALVAAMSLYLLQRYPMLVAGRSEPVDVVVFLVWIALCLMPFFQEMSFFGLRFSQTIDELKTQVAEQMNSLRSEIRNSIDIRPQISTQFNLPSPPPDSQLPALEEQIRRAVGEEFQRRGAEPPPSPASSLDAVDSDLSLMFSARYHIERELRRLASELEYVGQPRYPITRLTEMLADLGLLRRCLGRSGNLKKDGGWPRAIFVESR